MKRLNQILEKNEMSHVLPFLWMKGEDNETIQKELDKIKECSIQQICLESRPHPDFVGQGWWENLDFIMKEAKARGMRVWVLDDDKFPTGHCNGAFEEKYPELEKIYLAERHVDTMGPCRNGAVLVENFMDEESKLLGILAFKKPDTETLAISPQDWIDLTEQYKDGFVYFDLPPHAYRLFVIYTTKKGGGRPHYMNLIDSESVKVLIDEVYEKHYERYQDEFGNTFAGFFSDEPELGNTPGYSFHVTLGTADMRLPWSLELEGLLKENWKSEFLFNLPALWYERGKGTTKIRSQFMDTLTQLVEKCFSRQIGNWCRSHGVEYIGHIIEDDNAHARMGCSTGHYFREMKGQHMAGIDVVHHQIVPGFTEKVHQWIAGDCDGEFFHFGLAKLASSAAHIDKEKKGRALCEIFGNYGWAEGVSFMKWLTNHMLVRGINEFTPHAFSMQYPDRDCPPHFYAQGNNPQFDCFAQLMSYMNRGAHLLSGGVHLAEAAVLYHGESEWSGGRTMLFQKPVRKLMEHQMDCDVIPTDSLEEVQAEDGKLILCNETYQVLILPYCEYFPREAVSHIIRFAKAGVPIMIMDSLPKADTWREPLPVGFFHSVKVVSLDKLAEQVRECIKPVFRMDRNYLNLRSLFIRQQDGIVCMFFNESLTQKIRDEIYLKEVSGKSFSVVDLWNAKAVTYPLLKNRFLLELEPGEARIFVVHQDKKEKMEVIPIYEGQKVLDLNWTVARSRGGKEPFSHVLNIRKGEPLPNMNGPMQDPLFSGVYCYEGSFVQKKEKMTYFLMLPKAGDIAKIFINEIDLGYLAGFPGRVEVTDALRDGENQIKIEITNTLVWERKDGASTHLQLSGTGLLQLPILLWYSRG